MLDVYLIRPGSSFTASSIVHGINYHHWVIQEIEWEESCCVPQVEPLALVYHKTDILGLKTLLLDKLGLRASNGSSVKEIWNNSKEIKSTNFEIFST